jgi:hypothetical protein
LCKLFLVTSKKVNKMHSNPRNAICGAHTVAVHKKYKFEVLLSYHTNAASKGTTKHTLRVRCGATNRVLCTRSITLNGAAFLYHQGIADLCNPQGFIYSEAKACSLTEHHFYRGAALAYAEGRGN